MHKNGEGDIGDSLHEQKSSKLKRSISKKYKLIIATILLVFASSLVYVGYIYAASPDVIRNPKLEHYHFRMQIVVSGKSENFADKKYQTDYAKDQCNANLPEQPIHFHDNMDQFTHIHWEGMTGGMVMKYYGWNYIGGLNNALGYKLDDLSNVQKVTTHGDYLPPVPSNTNFYIYTGDLSNYEARGFDDWKTQDLEKFFGKSSNSPAHEENKQKTSLLDEVFPTAYAHGTADDIDGDDGTETEEEKRTRINNLIGNVVIFVQKDKPTDQQIKDRFTDLEPLADSTCGG